MRELSSIIGGANTPRAIRKNFLRIVDGPNKFITIEPHPQPAIGADHYSLRLQASDLLMGLLAAARARDWEKVMVLQHEALTPSLVAQLG